MASRSSCYKTKQSALDKREKRILRVHRRSIDQREMRQEEVNKRRQIEIEMSPIIESRGGSKIPSRNTTPDCHNEKASLSLQEKFRKWKEERELKRKIEAMEKARIKPGFKVTHISYTDTKLFNFTKDDPKESSSKKSHKKILKNTPIKSVKVAPAPTKRTLRSTGSSAVVNSSIPKSSSSNKKQNSLLVKNHEQMVVKRKATTVSTSPDLKKLKALSSKNKVSLQTVGQGHFMAPTRSSSRKTVSKMKQDIPHSEDKKTKYKSQDNKIIYNQHKPDDARKVSTLRGNVKDSVEPSFAPTNFAFAAPGNICSFVFKSLSPASAASFLIPNGDNTNVSLFSNNVGRTSTPLKAESVQSLCGYNDSQSDNDWMTKSEIDVSKRSSSVSSKHKLLRYDYKETTGDMLQKGNFPEEQESDSVDCTAKESENVEMAESFIPTSQKHKSTKSVHNLSDTSMRPLHETLESANKSLRRSMELNSKNALSNAEICPTVQALGDDNLSGYQKELDRKSAIDFEVGYQTDKNAKTSKIRQNSLHDHAMNLDAEHLEHIKASPGRRISRQLRKSITNNMVIETKPELEITHGRSRRSCRSLLPDCKAKLESPCMINQAEMTNYMSSSSPSFAHFESFGSQHTHKSSIEDSKIHHECPSLEVASFIVGAETETLKGTSSVLEQNTDAEKSVRKLRSLRRSAARSNKDHSQSEAIEKEEAKQVLSVAMPEGNRQENLNPKLRRSRRSVAKTDTFTLHESVPSELSTGEVEMKSFETPKSTTSRKSLICTSALTALQEDEQQLMMHKVEENCGFVGKSLSDSIAGSPSALKELVLNQDVSSAVERETALSIDICSERETVSNDIVLSVQKTPMRTRRSLHLPGASDGFLTPGLPLSIQKRSTAKRRRTATMIALSSAKSPEEAIRIISTSPMVEMTRRTPKHISPEQIKNCTALLFSDDDLSVEPIKLFPDPKEQLSGKEENIPSSITLEENQKQKGVSYFRCLLNAETEKLAALGDMWESIGQSVPGLCEEVQGQIRTTVCQARLLIGDKFQQFAGLVDDCERGDPRTTCQDLQGFWDLICIPVEDLNKKFAALVTLKDNNWQLDLDEPAILPVKKGTKKRMPATKVDKPVGKSKFAAFKAHLVQQRTKTDVTEEKVFDAGFFKVSSPVHTPVFHSEAGTPNKQKSPFNSTKEPENKENVAHSLLRRSLGTMSPHTNYIPSTLSPLLQDISLISRKSCIARQPSERQYSTSQDELGVRQEESVTNSVKQSHEVPTKSTPCRRSTRIRKSVCFVDPEPSINQPEAVGNKEPIDLTAYLQPSTYSNKNSPLQASSVELEDSPFNCDSLLINSTNINSSHSILTDTLSTPIISLLSAPGNGQKNYQKRLPSAERRKSRRSVSFALSPSQNLQSCTQALPSTPYNRDSIVASKRILRRSNLGNICETDSSEMQSLKDIYPKPSSRPSLLFTPPQKSQSHSPLVCNDVPVATLISFTP